MPFSRPTLALQKLNSIKRKEFLAEEFLSKLETQGIYSQKKRSANSRFLQILKEKFVTVKMQKGSKA